MLISSQQTTFNGTTNAVQANGICPDGWADGVIEHGRRERDQRERDQPPARRRSHAIEVAP